MSDEREKALGEFRQQAGGIDPVIDASANYAKAIKATREVVREQGQVMSATLENNALLYHTNKKLVSENRALKANQSALEFDLKNLQRRIEGLTEHNERLIAAGGDRYKVLYEQSRDTLLRYLHSELDNDQLRVALDGMKAQAAELAKLPELVTEQELKDMDVIEKTPEELQAEHAADTQRSS